MTRLALLFAAACASSGCVSINYERSNTNAPIRAAALTELGRGNADLGRCLEVLGAPNLVWQTPEGAALAYVNTGARGFNFRVSANVRNMNASVSYDTVSDTADTVALFFDEGWQLHQLRRGQLRDILPTAAQRSSPPLRAR